MGARKIFLIFMKAEHFTHKREYKKNLKFFDFIIANPQLNFQNILKFEPEVLEYILKKQRQLDPKVKHKLFLRNQNYAKKNSQKKKNKTKTI